MYVNKKGLIKTNENGIIRNEDFADRQVMEDLIKEFKKSIKKQKGIRDDIDYLFNEIEELNDKNNSLREDVENLADDVEDLTDDIEDLKDEIEDLKDEIEDLKDNQKKNNNKK